MNYSDGITYYGYCNRHGAAYFGRACPHCAEEAEAKQALADELRDALNILEARIADQDTAIALLRRRVVELEHNRNSSQAAVNAQAAAIEALESRIEAAARLLARANVRLVAE